MMMMTSNIISRSLPTMMMKKVPATVSSHASLSTQASRAVQKLQSIMQEYRQANYTQCIPSRFKKDVVRAATNNNNNSNNNSDRIEVENLEQVLRNIGASDKITHQELEMIFLEEGDSHGRLAPQQLANMLL
mmetsp:Transcript_21561/g.36736  ORF Transcript_21561/g.36736 Transcript_21561/m.36736 type:complete len:132 (-) Transcript_21561:486-881(-)